MALAETARLVADLSLKGNFVGQMTGAQKALKGFDAKLSDTQGRAYKAGQQIGTGIKNGLKIAAVGVGLLASQVLLGLRSLATLEKAQLQTNAVIKSTGGAAKISATAVRGLAEEFENLNATIDDKVIQSTENLLLTFTNIKDKAFKPTLQAILDMNTAMGGDENSLKSVTIQVGKALNDPAKGLTALRRVGVAFSKEQEKRIKKLQTEGKLYEAQKLILKELGREFGGSFKAQGKSAEATIAGIGDAVEDLQIGLARGLFPVIQKVLPQIRTFLQSSEFTKGVTDFGNKLAGLFSDANLKEGASILQGLFKAAKEAAPALEAAAQTTGKVISTAVGIFKSLPPEIQSLAIAGLAINKLTGGLVTNLAGGLISAVISSFRGLMNVNAAVVNVNGPVAGLGGAAAAGGTSVAGAASLLLAPAAVAAAGLIIKDQLDKQGQSLQEKAVDFAGSATDKALAKSIDGVRKTVDKLGGDNAFGVRGKTVDVLNILIAEQNRRRTEGARFRDRGGRFDGPAGLAPGPVLDRGGRFDKAVNKFAKAADKFNAKAAIGDILKGIRARSAAKFGGTGLGEAAVTGTFQRKLLHNAETALRANVSTATKLGRLERIQAELKAHGDTRTAAKVGGKIDRLKATLAAKDLSVKTTVNVTTKNVINGRVLVSALTRTALSKEGRRDPL